MLSQRKRKRCSHTTRRRLALAMLLIPISGCASSGLDRLTAKPPVMPPEFAATSAVAQSPATQWPATGQAKGLPSVLPVPSATATDTAIASSAEHSVVPPPIVRRPGMDSSSAAGSSQLAGATVADGSFLEVPVRLGKPDQPIPSWNPEQHRSRIHAADKTNVAIQVPPQDQPITTNRVAVVGAIAELEKDETAVARVFRPVSHRMQGETIRDRLVETDLLELSPAKQDARSEAEVRLAEAVETEQRAASQREQAQRELDARVSDAKEAALNAQRLAKVVTVENGLLSLDAASGLEAGQPIDLGAALGMAGGNAWTIQLARQKTVEAHSEVDRAEAIWLPNLQVGVGWNQHEGRIQATDGSVIEASRSSVFLGGGATLGSPVAGGSGGPLRLSADLAIAEAYFAPKIARRNHHAARFGISVAKNNALLQAGTAYMNLLESAAQVADAQAAIAASDELVQLTRTFEQAGAGAQADVDRAATDRGRLQQRLQDATRTYRVRSAALARRLRLDPTQLLQPADAYLVPVNLTDQGQDSVSLVETALRERPEVCEQTQLISALCIESRKEAVAPWIPSVTMATSAGAFSGGTGSTYSGNGGRGDLDIQALWELENLGLGVAAKRKNVASRLAQQRIILADIRDQVRLEVVQAYENVENYWHQIQSAESTLVLAETSYERNLLRVKNDEGLPIELLQAINARAEGLRARTTAVAAYNRSQVELLYALGRIRG